jgi:hypothetical protein
MVRAHVDEKTLALRLMTARSVADAEDISAMAEVIYGPLSMRPVGDRPNNSGTIRVGSDPALGVVERIVNAIDAVLDLGRAEHPDDSPRSPREAAQMWFGVPAAGIADMRDGDRRALGERIRVWLDESGEAKRPTVVIEDRGIGQAPPRFPTTLVSLNEQNKVGQPWNSGTYGQGGAVGFGFSDATIIISRRHPALAEGGHGVGWTLVRRVEDPEALALPNYQYVVDGDKNVLELDPGLFPDFPSGTRVIHIGYDLQGWTGPFTTGLWQFLNAAVFEPVLPFLLTGKRNKEKSYGSRIITGNAARLQRPEKARGDLDVAHKDSVQFDLGPRLGSVTFNYWVLRRPPESESTTDAAASYARPDAAVSMTLFGQRQDTLPRSWIKDSAKLPFLYKGMVVQVSADGLTPVAKSEVFASTRERATKSDTLNRIYTHLASVLRNDDVLADLNHEEKERLLAKSTGAASEKIRQRLANFVKTRLKGITKPVKGGDGDGDGGRKRPPKRPPRPRPKRSMDDAHLPNVPTRLRFVVLEKGKTVRERTEPVRVVQGSGGYTWVEVDAKNGYLPAHNDELTLSWAGDPERHVRLALRSKLLGGLTRWYFEADPEAPDGDYALTATLLTANGVLADTIAISVVKPPEVRPNKKNGEEPETGPDVRWVYEEQWADHNGMDAKTVGYVTVDEEETIIWLNRDYEALKRALAARDLTPEAIETRATRYQYPIACALWLQHHELSKTTPRPDERYEKAEKQRLAEAVLVAIDPDVDVAMEESEG